MSKETKKNIGYNKSLLVQKHMADKLEIFMSKSPKEFSILEVGCGIGGLTEKILKYFPNSKVDLLDNSITMLKNVREGIEDEGRVNYIFDEVIEYSSNEKYDLIFSNATFHWIDEHERLYKNLGDQLNQGGKLVFSTFGSRNYCELRERLNMVEGKCFRQTFMSKKSIKKLLGKDFKILVADEEHIIENYKTIDEFLESIRNPEDISKALLSRENMEELEKEYQDEYGSGGKLDITNHLIYIIAEKI